MTTFRTLLSALALLVSTASHAQQPGRIFKPKNREMRHFTPEYLMTDDARRVGDQILLYQRVTGGWPKNVDMCSPFTPQQAAQIAADKQRTDDSTTDNNATSMQMNYLAALYRATGEEKYRDAVRRAVDWLLSGQYESGGWPQFWPDNHGYQEHITYNDNAMVNTLSTISDMVDGRGAYSIDSDLVTDSMRERLRDSFARGIECILATQILNKDGEPTVWCQQHYRDTYLPAPARAYELPSYCSSESVGLVQLLMGLPHPDARACRAIHGAMKWFDTHKIKGYRVTHRDSVGRHIDTTLVPDDGDGCIWARFYDLDEELPYVCDRDGQPRRRLEEIGTERRNGYGWYNTSAEPLYALYAQWCERQGQTPVALDSSGLNIKGINAD